jgi:hypothetical protein
VCPHICGRDITVVRGLTAAALLLSTVGVFGQGASVTRDTIAEVTARDGAASSAGVPYASSGNLPGAVKPAAGTVIGTVKDTNGNTIDGAAIILKSVGSEAQSTATADANGFFRFSVDPGDYVATISSPGLTTWMSGDVAVNPGGFREIPDIVLKVNAAVFVVHVAPPTQQQIAEEQIHAEEHQRLIGILPNFYVSYDPNPAPLTTRQKFELAWKNSTDAGSITADAATAGFEQAQNSYPAYKQGVMGFTRRFGAAYGNDVGGTFIGAAILPTVFHQDPRYFYRGTGSIWSRTFYAVSTIAVCRGDNGRTEPNYSFIVGNMAAGALSNVFYPQANRGWGMTMKGGALASLQGISGRLMQEFLLKHVSKGVPGK